MPLRGVRSFGAAMRSAGKAMRDEIAPLFLGKLGFELLAGTVRSSPVDLGTLRGGWDLSLNFAIDRPSPPDKTGQAAIARARSVAARTDRSTRRMVISTPVAHAPVIEGGRRLEVIQSERIGPNRPRFVGSIQAPQGMLGINVQRLRKSIPPASVLRDVRIRALELGFDS